MEEQDWPWTRHSFPFAVSNENGQLFSKVDTSWEEVEGSGFGIRMALVSASALPLTRCKILSKFNIFDSQFYHL